uniref:Uncharacterized protein n=1 Tax=Denticeps clupeoides TaxID=299321 RepID=A0AAY4ED52_9TELE
MRSTDPQRSYAGAVGPGFLLMQDNARHHVAGVASFFFLFLLLLRDCAAPVFWLVSQPGC